MTSDLTQVINGGATGRRESRRATRRLCVVLALVAVVGAVMTYLGVAAGSQQARRELVTPPGLNVPIEHALLRYLGRQARDPAHQSAAVGGSATPAELYRRPRVLGLLHPRRNVVVVAAVDRVRLAGKTYRVYTIATMLNDTSRGYRVVEAATVCDRVGRGVVVAVPVPGHDLVVALDVREEVVPNVGSGVPIPPGKIAAWSDPRLRVDVMELVHRPGERVMPCPSDA